jgi:hypothetical protein
MPNDDTSGLGSQILRGIILPAIENEVNEGKTFALVRQIYAAEIMATWFKKTLRRSLLAQIFANKSKIAGQSIKNPQATVEKIYQQYLKAYKKGVFNFIKEDTAPDGTVVPRKYFSGGAVPVRESLVEAYTAHDAAQSSVIAAEVGDFAQTVAKKKWRWVLAAVALAFWTAPAHAQIYYKTAGHVQEESSYLSTHPPQYYTTLPGDTYVAPAVIPQEQVKEVQELKSLSFLFYVGQNTISQVGFGLILLAPLLLTFLPVFIFRFWVPFIHKKFAAMDKVFDAQMAETYKTLSQPLTISKPAVVRHPAARSKELGAQFTVPANTKFVEPTLRTVAADDAMLGQTPPGGIDLSDRSLSLHVKVDGRGMPLPMSQQDKTMLNVKGLVSVIRNITPLTPQNAPELYALMGTGL